MPNKANSESSILIHALAPRDLPVVTGCPVPAQAWGDQPGMARLRQSDGALIPVQVYPLTGPTPNGTRWLELSFLASAAGKADFLADPVSDKPAESRAKVDGGPFDNGLLRIRLAVDPALPPVSIDRLDAAGKWLYAGSLVPEVETEKGFVHRDDPAFPRTLRVLREGPMRQQVELSGRLKSLSGRPSLSYRITVELWAGLSAVRIDWMLAHLEPGIPAFQVQRATLEGRWEAGNKAERRFVQTSYGTHYRSREVRNPAPVALLTDFTCGGVHVADPGMLLDDQEYAHYLAPPTVRTQEWLALEGDGLAVFATVQDFAASRPNRLSSQGDKLSYDMIPPGLPTEWPQGRRREQTLLLAFAPAGAPAAEAVKALSKVCSFGRATPEPATLARLRCFEIDLVLARRPGRNVRLSKFMRRLCTLDMPGNKWDLGDTPEEGYTRSYASTPNCLRFKPGAPALPVQYGASGGNIYPDSMETFLEPVWTNNEYDIIHGIATEIMRTGDAQPMTTLRWAARHQVEVDFVAFNDDPWHHRATPFHSHFHNTKGAISSHFFTQGLIQYYLLTGDRDAREVVEALGDKIIEIDSHEGARTWKFDREIGWGLLALVCLVEAGFDRFRPECDKIAGFLQDFDRAHFTGAVNLTRGKAGRSLERQMVDNGIGYVPMVEAMDRYQRVTGRADTAAWLEKLLRQLHAEMWNVLEEGDVPSMQDMVTHMLAFAYERTGDPACIKTGLVFIEAFLDGLSTGGGARAFWGGAKPHGKLYRALARYLGHADRLNLLDRFEYPALLEMKRPASAGDRQGGAV